MKTRKLIILLALLLAVLALAVGASAQGTPGDTDGDGIPNENDRCPRQPAPNTIDGCPGSPTLPPPQVDDRDGDGVLDFVDRCPDQAGTGFTEGCPTTGDTAQPTPIPPPFQWETYTACMVANLGTENINIRAFIPDPNNPAQPVFLGVLQPGQQFAPVYVDYDVNNTPWYAGVGAQLGLADGQSGWVNGVVTTNNGVCDYLSAPPTTGRAVADSRICLVLVPDGEDIPVFSRNLPDDTPITRLEPGSIFPASGVFLDESGAPWFRGLAENGWVRGIDVVTEGNCFPLIPTDVPDVDGIIPLGGGGGGTCLIVIPESGIGLYNIKAHDPTALIATFQEGVTFQATGAGMDADGHLWYFGGGWVDSAEVLATGNCLGLPEPAPADLDQCQILIPPWNPDVNMYEQPVADPALLIYAIPAGAIRIALAKTWDANSQVWYWANYGQGGWVSGSEVIVLNQSVCNDLVLVAPPSDPNVCLITIPEGDGVNAYVGPAHDDALLYTVLSPGWTGVAEFADFVTGTLWYHTAAGFVSNHQVIATGNCADLPPYTYASNVCHLFTPSDVPGVVVLDNYEGDMSGFVTMINPAEPLEALFAATNSQGVRWYYVKPYGEGTTALGWVNSEEVIEFIPSACDNVPPMIIFHIPDFFLELAIQPLVYPFPEPMPVIGQ